MAAKEDPVRGRWGRKVTLRNLRFWAGEVAQSLTIHTSKRSSLRTQIPEPVLNAGYEVAKIEFQSQKAKTIPGTSQLARLNL